jgi:hypothetical protein
MIEKSRVEKRVKEDGESEREDRRLEGETATQDPRWEVKRRRNLKESEAERNDRVLKKKGSSTGCPMERLKRQAK